MKRRFKMVSGGGITVEFIYVIFIIFIVFTIASIFMFLRKKSFLVFVACSVIGVIAGYIKGEQIDYANRLTPGVRGFIAKILISMAGILIGVVLQHVYIVCKNRKSLK